MTGAQTCGGSRDVKGIELMLLLLLLCLVMLNLSLKALHFRFSFATFAHLRLDLTRFLNEKYTPDVN